MHAFPVPAVLACATSAWLPYLVWQPAEEQLLHEIETWQKVQCNYPDRFSRLNFNFLVPSPVGQWYALDWGRGGGDNCASAGCHTKYGNHAEVAHASTASTGRHALTQYYFNHGPIHYAIIIIYILYIKFISMSIK